MCIYYRLPVLWYSCLDVATVMRVVVTGDRHWDDYQTPHLVLEKLPNGTVVVNGAAPGLDTIVWELCLALGIEWEVIFADWERYGPGAGPKRNGQMLDTKPDIVYAFHNDFRSSKGTKNCVKQAEKRNLPVSFFTSNYGKETWRNEELFSS